MIRAMDSSAGSGVARYDAVLVVSFGGPEAPEDVLPFLEKVTAGRGVPAERLLEVASHYDHFGGRSPINDQNRVLIAALRLELDTHSLDLPVYWGNRNWHPLLADTVRQMEADGVRNALAFVTSAYSSYSGCHQYREDIEAARQVVGLSAPAIDKIRPFFNHPGFVETQAELVLQTLSGLTTAELAGCRLAFCAHSIPTAQAETCDYVQQLLEVSRLVAAFVSTALGRAFGWDLVFQSRSGPPQVPWLEPDVLEHVQTLAKAGDTSAVVLIPAGFVSDHMEVCYDLDTEALTVASELGLVARRVPTVGTHPKFIAAIRELIEERLFDSPTRRSIGELPAMPDACSAGCCPVPRRTSP